MVSKKKTSQGRQKIAIEKIASEEARHVCFSKRRNGIFTKASDLVTLCGAEVAMVVESPAGNPYSFASPGMKDVVDRFLSGNNSHSGSSSSTHMVPQLGNLARELNNHCMDLSTQIDNISVKKSMLEARLKELVDHNPFCQLVEGIEGHRLAELQTVEALLVGFKANVDAIRESMAGGGASSSHSIINIADPTRLMNQFSYGTNPGYLAGSLSYGRRFY